MTFCHKSVIHHLPYVSIPPHQSCYQATQRGSSRNLEERLGLRIYHAMMNNIHTGINESTYSSLHWSNDKQELILCFKTFNKQFTYQAIRNFCCCSHHKSRHSNLRLGKTPHPKIGNALDLPYPKSIQPRKGISDYQVARKDMRTHLHRHETVIDKDFLGEKVGTDSGLVLVWELFVHILVHERCLADTAIALWVWEVKSVQSSRWLTHYRRG